MKLFFIVSFSLIASSVTAQKKIFFSSQNYAGLLEGESGSQFQLETINGVKYKSWFAGLGTGIDWYYKRSFPVFLSINESFSQRRNRNFFIAANGGVNFPWEKSGYTNEWGYTVKKAIPGIYWESGFGYRIGMRKTNDALIIQFGYSYKYVGEKIQNNYIIPSSYFAPSQEYPNDRFNYHLKRLSLKFGWSF
jgi:hypothetical protein